MDQRGTILNRIEECIRLIETWEHQEHADYKLMDNLLEFKKWLIEPQKMVKGNSEDKNAVYCPACGVELTPFDSYCWFCGQCVQEGKKDDHQR